MDKTVKQSGGNLQVQGQILYPICVHIEACFRLRRVHIGLPLRFFLLFMRYFFEDTLTQTNSKNDLEIAACRRLFLTLNMMSPLLFLCECCHQVSTEEI